jgi:uncharacterized membrane protein
MKISQLPADRVLFFSDAVFAIAMTLLVLEIDLPSSTELQNNDILSILQLRIPNFIGFSISFLVTALFWRAHVLICKHLKEVNDRFLWINLLQLLFVVLMPYSTALYSNYGFGSNVAYSFYAVNLALIGLFHCFLILEVYKHIPAKNKAERLYKHWQLLKSVVVVFIFFASALLCWALPMLARYLFVGIFVIHLLIDKIYQKKILRNTIETNA